MKTQDFIDAIEELNEELPEEVYAEGIYYEYCTDGFTDMVNFANYNIFHSDFDMEEGIETVGGIKEYLVFKRNEFIDVLIKVKGNVGTTTIACLNTNRNYIGFELDTKYYELANKRIEEHKNTNIKS